MKKLKLLRSVSNKSTIKVSLKPLMVISILGTINWKMYLLLMGSKLSAESGEVSYQEVRSREWRLPEHWSESQRFSFLMKLHQHSMKLHRKRFKVQLRRLCKIGPPSSLHIEWVPLKNVVRSLFLSMELFLKKEASMSWRIKEGSFPSYQLKNSNENFYSLMRMTLKFVNTFKFCQIKISSIQNERTEIIIFLFYYK